jgi:hypothetical protein
MALAEGRLLRAFHEPRLQLDQEPRLADARLPDHGDQVRATLVRDPRVDRLEQLELVCPADEWGLRAPHAAPLRLGGKHSGRLPRSHGLGLPFESERLECLVLDRLLRRAVSALADGDAARPCRRLKSRRNVDGISDDGVALANLTGDDLTGVDAYPQGKADPVRSPELLVDLFHCALHAEGRSHGTLGIVLVGDGGAEDRHHVVADVLVHPAAVVLDFLPQTPKRPVDQALDRLGIHALRDRGVAGEVGEQNGDLPPLLRKAGGGAGPGARRDLRRGLGLAVGSRRARVHGGAAGHAELRLRRGDRVAGGAAALEPRPAGHAKSGLRGVLGSAVLAEASSHGQSITDTSSRLRRTPKVLWVGLTAAPRSPYCSNAGRS